MSDGFGIAQFTIYYVGAFVVAKRPPQNTIAAARWRSGDAEAMQGFPAWFDSRPGLQFSEPLRKSRAHGLAFRSSFERIHDFRAQIGRYLRQNTEPGLEGRTRLMQQHAKAVYRDIAARLRCGQERGFRRDVDEIGDESLFR